MRTAFRELGKRRQQSTSRCNPSLLQLVCPFRIQLASPEYTVGQLYDSFHLRLTITTSPGRRRQVVRRLVVQGLWFRPPARAEYIQHNVVNLLLLELLKADSVHGFLETGQGPHTLGPGNTVRLAQDHADQEIFLNNVFLPVHLPPSHPYPSNTE